jgi:uncharacterized membrane protein YeaQ/YmgE (transglycosylase-associated protein family)
MPILAWIVVGIIGGFIGSRFLRTGNDGLVGDLFLGVIGGIVGGWAFNQFGHSGVTGINLYSILVSAVGSILVLVVYHALTSRRLRA